MKSILSYKSIALNPLTLARTLLIGFVFPLLVCILLIDKKLFLLSSAVTFIVLLTQLVYAYSKISYDGIDLKLESLVTRINLTDVEAITSWWNYGFSTSTIDLTDATEEKRMGHSNMINCYVKFKTKTGVAYIREQIVLGSKFPNNLPYMPTEPVDEEWLVEVWDIDNCLEGLKLKDFNA